LRISESGNFLLQALLAVSLVIAFMPWLAGKMSNRQRDAEMTATVRQISAATGAAREFIRENSSSINYGVSIYEGDRFVDTLEPYGLPLGFVPMTPFGQKISMNILKNESDVIALVVLSDGNLSATQRAELAVRIGFWAASGADKLLRGATAGWELDLSSFGAFTLRENNIYVRIPSSDEMSELIPRRVRNIDDSRFHTDLIMNGFDVRGIDNLDVREGNFTTVMTADLLLSGIEDGRRMRHQFGNLNIRRAAFSGGGMGAGALSISRGTLVASDSSAASISRFGESGNLNAGTINVFSWTMADGRTGFSGPAMWDIRGDGIFENVTLNTDVLQISGFINASRGQDVFIDEQDLSYSTQSGIATTDIYAAHITLRDQTSAALLAGETGPILVDIRPAGVSILPDAFVADINNDGIEIPISPDNNDGTTVACKNIIDSIGGDARYNANSLSQNIVCQYVFWQRLEQRINMKKCMLDGGGKCGY